ncbi:phosphoethanolamine--lipid A transferase EptA [Maribacter sp. PR1]|uniref:Phosphoethanolamine--lipid A transferase EptA n=1 Tax=Maribacter cobaltidurans TaxID=1178778 RepID=A0ABU7IYH5_9FLAO|nr:MULTISPECIES: phosphoethanolamine--lipid A transferase EptA [Maribacter]MDC6390587.1 phosphoethanolamine--lipid A transferase EptA [Maribacter sp. PR1]MEE1977978.1 phosphoethanolamine--lipid A transferase EptA [Maribacter cobaltidurans]
MLRHSVKLAHFVLVASTVNFLFFHYPFFKYVFTALDYQSFGGITIIVSLVIAMLVANAFALYLIFFLSRFVGKLVLAFFFIINAVAIYFVNTYHVIIDPTMIGNILNTNYEEASSFLSFRLLLYVILLGIIPVILIIKVKISKETFKRFLIHFSLTLIFLIAIVLVNGGNWRWIDKNSPQLGALVMPWSYMINTSRLYINKSKENEKEIILPDTKITDKVKSIAVLVIGESARSENFSLYGYKKPTNPLLSEVENLHSFNATACATYTTAGVKCLLEHTNSNKLYEILPNYLYRNNVEVIWRTTNWGEPPVHITNFLKKEDLKDRCKGQGCNYDEILLKGLKEQILTSKKDKILVVLHTSTSHGPSYNTRYPPEFEKFAPVCKSVELGECSQEELINAYDNTIVYTDYILASLIKDLKELKEYNSTMLFVSDHGESLGEYNLYMHGIPAALAPKEQLEIPFIVWLSDGSKKLNSKETLSQHHVFHSILNFLAIESPIYDENLNIFK